MCQPSLPAGACAEEQIGRPAHVLDAAGDDHLRVAGADGLRREHHSLQTRTAHLVDGERCDAVGEAGREGGLARRVLPQPRLEHIADDHLVHTTGGHVRPFQRLGDGDRAELRGGNLGEGPEKLADGSAGCGEENGFVHD
jgi:hypothetical protein